MAHPLLVQDFPKLLPMRPSVFQIGCPEVQPYMGSRIDFLLVARVMEVNSSPFCFFQPTALQPSCVLPISGWSLLGTRPCIDGTWLPTLGLRHLCFGADAIFYGADVSIVLFLFLFCSFIFFIFIFC